MNENWIELIAYVIVFLIGVLVTRAIFSIPAILKYQKAKMVLLALMAQKAGVDVEKIKETVRQAGQEINI